MYVVGDDDCGEKFGEITVCWHEFLILACDGLWKSFSNEEAIKYVNELLEKSVKGMDDKEIWQQVADELAAEAVRRKCGDNVSVIVVRLHK
uniref:PPM-type phosphatase domain-containing protein n=1 Tax=Angiostrongylus cantonensis TaxID=6313 RepID=A0A0K0DCW7_ANGCA